jgi:hypothetical protein
MPRAKPNAPNWSGCSWPLPEGKSDGDLLVVPDVPHSLVALADAAVLLSVAKRR